jgi:hypothetical protein
MLRYPMRTISMVIILIGLLGISACGTTVIQTVTVNGTPKPGTPGTPAATLPPTTCAKVLPGAGTPSGGSQFTDVTFPSNSVGMALKKQLGGGDGQFTIWTSENCVEHSTVADIQKFYTDQLPTHAWKRSDYFPFDGYLQKYCGDPYCWAGAGASPRYVGLDNATADKGGGTIYFKLTFATPPSAPVCASGFEDGYYYRVPLSYKTTKVYNNIPLPPLTRLKGDNASGATRGYDICTAASATTFLSFMDKQLTASGWKLASSSSGKLYRNGTYEFTIMTSPLRITWKDPDNHP